MIKRVITAVTIAGAGAGIALATLSGAANASTAHKDMIGPVPGQNPPPPVVHVDQLNRAQSVNMPIQPQAQR